MIPPVRFDPESGLAPAIVQHAGDGRVLMLGWMNREALEATLSGWVTFFSRSRDRLWEKGERSGNALRTVEVRTDCDGDALLVRALPAGPICHTGAESCFDAGETVPPATTNEPVGPAERVAAPEDGGSGPESRGLGAALAALAATVAARDRKRPPGSRTAELLSAGAPATARKVAEEAVETAIAALTEPDRVVEESADLLYHLLVLWRACGVTPDAVAAVLEARRG